MLLKEVSEVRVWTHVLLSSLVFKMCCVARYKGCCEETGDDSLWWMRQGETVLYGSKRKYSWQLASTALNLNHLQGPWNSPFMKPEALLLSGMFKCMCKAQYVN